MKRLLKTLTILATVASGAVLFQNAAKAQPGPGQTGFWCHTQAGQYPTTMYQSANGEWEPWIRWASHHFTGSGYDPLTRCREVSGRMETYRRNRQLYYITAGRMNGENVICTASQVNGRCENLIYTLRPGADVIQTLQTFMAWREGQAATPSLCESGQVPYINVGDRLYNDNAPATTSAPTPQTAPAPAAVPAPAPRPSSNGGGMRDL